MFHELKSYFFLLFIYFLIYTAFLFIQISTIYKAIPHYYPNNVTNNVLIAIEGISVLLGGVSAAFIIPAIILLSISLISLLIGVSFYEVLFGILNNSKDHPVLFFIALISFSIFVGLVRFLFLVIIIDQNKSKFVKRKLYGWFITTNVSYLFVYSILANLPKTKYAINICFASALTGVILFVIGKYLRFFEIDSRILNIFQLIKAFKKKPGNFDSFDDESKKAIISISTSIIFFILLIPIGICDSQNRYAYQYQFNHLAIGTNHNIFWVIVCNATSAIIFSIILVCVETFNLSKFKTFLSNVKLSIIVGIILLIISSMLSGIVETVRLEIFYNWNRQTGFPYNCSLNQTIGEKTYLASCLSIYIMLPQIVINGISEVFLLVTCVEYLYKQSIKSIKYLSISLVLAAHGSGGLSDIFFIVLPYVYGFNGDQLNERNRLDYIYYFLGGIAFLSLIIGIILMKKFPNRFIPIIYDVSVQRAPIIDYGSIHNALVSDE